LRECCAASDIWGTYSNVILQLNAPGRVQLNFFQRLAHNIVGLALARLGSFDGCCLVNVPLIIDIELSKCVGEPKDFVLLELRKFPALVSSGV